MVQVSFAKPQKPREKALPQKWPKEIRVGKDIG